MDFKNVCDDCFAHIHIASKAKSHIPVAWNESLARSIQSTHHANGDGHDLNDNHLNSFQATTAVKASIWNQIQALTGLIGQVSQLGNQVDKEYVKMMGVRIITPIPGPVGLGHASASASASASIGEDGDGGVESKSNSNSKTNNKKRRLMQAQSSGSSNNHDNDNDNHNHNHNHNHNDNNMDGHGDAAGTEYKQDSSVAKAIESIRERQHFLRSLVDKRAGDLIARVHNIKDRNVRILRQQKQSIDDTVRKSIALVHSVDQSLKQEANEWIVQHQAKLLNVLADQHKAASALGKYLETSGDIFHVVENANSNANANPNLFSNSISSSSSSSNPKLNVCKCNHHADTAAAFIDRSMGDIVDVGSIDPLHFTIPPQSFINRDCNLLDASFPKVSKFKIQCTHQATDAILMRGGERIQDCFQFNIRRVVNAVNAVNEASHHSSSRSSSSSTVVVEAVVAVLKVTPVIQVQIQVQIQNQVQVQFQIYFQIQVQVQVQVEVQTSMNPTTSMSTMKLCMLVAMLMWVCRCPGHFTFVV